MGAIAVAGVALAPTAARAGCCHVTKTDPVAASSTVRVCTPDADEACAVVLFEGTLALGESHGVCSDEPTIVYQELDPATSAFGAPVGAACDEDREVGI
jgi:hypothetical protein